LRISGQIDRLVVRPDEVILVDFKTNRSPPIEVSGVPQAYLLQLAAYRLILNKVYDRRPVRAALLWTAVPALMPIPRHLLDTAERELLAGVPWA
jgi:ATP-dependent helicase/nuclease subunit A